MKEAAWLTGSLLSMPMVQSARSLGLIFEDGPFQGLEMHSWQETKGSSGAVGKVAWLLPGGIESPQCKALVHLWASKLPALSMEMDVRGKN